MSQTVDGTAAGLAGFILAGRLLDFLVTKGLLTDAEAWELISQTATEVAEENVEQRAAVRQALKALFPLAPL